MKRLILLGLAIVVLAVVTYVIGGFFALRYVEDRYSAIPMGATRTQVCHTLRHFTEVKVTPLDVPLGFREEFTVVVPGSSTYRYDYLGFSVLAIHIVYDKHGRVVRMIPTYE